jgi:hypothetical protein
VPAIFDNREAVVSDVLMSYGVDFGDVFRQSSIYVGRILKGEKPADLPVAQTSKFEFVINLKTARTHGAALALKTRPTKRTRSLRRERALGPLCTFGVGVLYAAMCNTTTIGATKRTYRDVCCFVRFHYRH